MGNEQAKIVRDETPDRHGESLHTDVVVTSVSTRQ